MPTIPPPYDPIYVPCVHVLIPKFGVIHGDVPDCPSNFDKFAMAELCEVVRNCASVRA